MLNKLCIPKEHGSRLHFYGLLFRNCNSSIELTIQKSGRRSAEIISTQSNVRNAYSSTKKKSSSSSSSASPRCPTWVLQIDCSECGTPTTFICLTWLLSTIL
ncbi:unnamed protein product [Sphagnum troendelagicum]